MTVRIDPTPREARVFQGRQAGLVTRSLAAVVDIAVVVASLVAIYVGVVAVAFLLRPRGFEIPALPWRISVAVGYLVMTLYLAFAWHGGGRTLGCNLMGLRVVHRRRGNVAVWIALLRAILTLAFPIGLAWVIVSRKNLSIQDVLLRTSVIYDWDTRTIAPAVYPADPTDRPGENPPDGQPFG